MNKLTAEVARMDIGHLKSFQANPHVGLSMKEEKYLQALEIALPVLEQKENECKPNHAQCCAEAGGDISICDCVNKDWVYLEQPQPSTTPQIDNDGREG